MADTVDTRYDNGQPATWIEEGTGKHYVMGMVNGQPTGQKVYMSPRAVNPYTTEQGPYKSGWLGGGSEWNTETGQWDKKSNALEKFTLGAALAPFAAFGIGALGGGSAATHTSTLLGEGGTPAGLSTSGVTPGLIGGSGLLTSTPVVGAGAIGTVPGAGASGTIPTSSLSQTLLRRGGEYLGNKLKDKVLGEPQSQSEADDPLTFELLKRATTLQPSRYSDNRLPFDPLAGDFGVPQFQNPRNYLR